MYVSLRPCMYVCLCAFVYVHVCAFMCATQQNESRDVHEYKIQLWKNWKYFYTEFHFNLFQFKQIIHITVFTNLDHSYYVSITILTDIMITIMKAIYWSDIFDTLFCYSQCTRFKSPIPSTHIHTHTCNKFNLEFTEQLLWRR